MPQLQAAFNFTNSIQATVAKYQCPDFEQLNKLGVTYFDSRENFEHNTIVSIKRCKTDGGRQCDDPTKINELVDQLNVEFFYLDSIYDPTNID